MVREVRQACKELKVFLARLALLVPQVLLVLTAREAKRESVAKLAFKVMKDSKVKVVATELMASAVLWVLWDLRVRRAHAAEMV